MRAGARGRARAGGGGRGRMMLGAVVGLIGLVAGCAEISAPIRDDAYEWRLFIGEEAISFHWPASRLPVRIWVQDEYGVPGHVQAGAEQWRAAFLYDEFDYVLTSDSNTADVIVRTDQPPPKLESLRLASAMAPECRGATDVDIPFANPNIITLPVRAYVYPRFSPDAEGFDECMALTTTHELGHALGIFQHSANPEDLMYSDPVVSEPSDRDLETMERVYHFPNTVQVVDRPGQ